MGKIKGKYIEDDAIDEANLQLETGPTNDFVLTADSTKVGGMKWIAPSTGTADDTAYNSTSWNTNLDSATKNAIRDKIETMDTAIGSNTSASHAESHTVASHSDTTATGAELDTLTGGGDTTLHDHDGISENTSARHTAGTDTALGSGAVAADHGTAATDQIVNVSYGTGSPPTASTTTEGSLFIKYTA